VAEGGLTNVIDITEQLQCHDCQAKNPYRYSWGRVCCRVRFLLGQPNREARQGWVDRWRKQGDADLVAQVIQRLKEIKP
jgi:hypothetical protein